MTGPADPAAARREAEEALKAHDVAVAGDEWAFAPISLDVADALRDLLAEPQEPVPDAVVRECGGRCHDALDSRSPCPACAADLSAPDAVVREALRASAPDAVREAAARVAALAEHQTNQHGTPFVTLWGQEGVDAMAALRRSLAAQDGGGA